MARLTGNKTRDGHTYDIHGYGIGLMGVMAEGFKNNTDGTMVEANDEILSLISPEHLERLLQICSEDGRAVLEYTDTGLVLIAEKDGDNFTIWQVVKDEIES